MRDHDSKVFKTKYLDYCVAKISGKNQVLGKDNHGHETKVHRRDLKVIDSDTKVAEMYKELRKMGRRDTQHCMSIKQIPDLEWEKEQSEKDSKEKKPNRTVKGTMRPSRKSMQTVTEIQEEVVETTVARIEQISYDFLTVATCVAAATIHTITAQ